MNVFIVPKDKVNDVRAMKFDDFNELDPIEVLIDGNSTFILPADIANNKAFDKLKSEFEKYEMKDAESFEPDLLPVEKELLSKDKSKMKGKELTDFRAVEAKLWSVKTVAIIKK